MEYNLKFNEEQMHVLNMAIGEIPHKHAAPLIQSINRQIMEAQAASAQAAASDQGREKAED